MLDILIIAILVLLLTIWLQSKPLIWRDAGIPYSIPLPLFGSMAPTFYSQFRTCFDNLYKKVGGSGIYGFHWMTTPALLVCDPNLVKRITTNESENFMERGVHADEENDSMSHGLFLSKGLQWKTYRSKMTSFFTPARIKAMIPLLHPTAEKFVQHLDTQRKNGPVNVHDASKRFAVDAVISTVFGLQPDSFENPESFFFSLQDELVSFSTALKSLVGSLSPTLYNLLGFTTLPKRIMKKMEQLTTQVIDQRIKGIGVRPDFVQGMVDLMQNEDLTMNTSKYNEDRTLVAKFNRFTITGHCMMMYLGGTETTANTLGFLLYELAVNPKIQDSARTEINSMLLRTSNQFSYEDLHSLKYVHMIIKETLRKYPTLIVLLRQCTRKFRLDDIEIPVGTIVIMPSVCYQNDAKYFPEPDKFIPDRFADDAAAKTGSFTPFGLGPRNCIGTKFAQTEIILALCHILPKFRLSPSARTSIPIKFSSSPNLTPDKGVWLQVDAIK